jgi:hypothetical protein
MYPKTTCESSREDTRINGATAQSCQYDKDDQYNNRHPEICTEMTQPEVQLQKISHGPEIMVDEIPILNELLNL